jgi:hypothetical protein
MTQSFASIPLRSNKERIEHFWFNILRQAGVDLGDFNGGDTSIPPTDFTITNNQSTPANVTGCLFDGSQVRGARISYCVYRNTTGGGATELSERGDIFITYKTVAGTWEIAIAGAVGNAGVTFSITNGGQVQYTSTNITGTNNVQKITFKAETILGV